MSVDLSNSSFFFWLPPKKIQNCAWHARNLVPKKDRKKEKGNERKKTVEKDMQKRCSRNTVLTGLLAWSVEIGTVDPRIFPSESTVELVGTAHGVLANTPVCFPSMRGRTRFDCLFVLFFFELHVLTHGAPVRRRRNWQPGRGKFTFIYRSKWRTS